MALLCYTEKHAAIFTTIFTHWPGLIFDSGLLPVNVTVSRGSAKYNLWNFWCILRLVYWSSWSNTQPTIERASMDGSMRKTLVQFSSWWLALARPNGLALDPENRRLYWVDTGNSVIQYTDLQQGNGAKVKLPVNSLYLFQPYGLALKENTLYWSTAGFIYSANKMTGGTVHQLPGSFSSPRDVHVYHNYTGIPGMW